MRFEEGRQGQEGRAEVSQPLTVVTIAAVMYEAYRALRERTDARPLPPWSEAPLCDRQQAIEHVAEKIGERRIPAYEPSDALCDAIIHALKPFLIDGDERGSEAA